MMVELAPQWAVDEIDHLRTEVERLRAEIDRLRAEVTNLREVSFAYVRLQAERGAEAI